MSKNIEILNELEKSHGLNNLARRGIISPTLLWYRDLFFEYDVFIKMGNKKEESIFLVCDKLNIGRTSVYKAIRTMNNE